MEIKLNGPSAIVAAVAVVGLGAYRVASMQAELETDALDELAAYLAAEYASTEMAALSATLESGRPVDEQKAHKQVEKILAAQKITFPSVSARGMWDAQDGGEVIARVEIEVDGGPPPDGEPVRYYRMRYRPLSGWSVRGQTSVWSYRLKLF